MKEIFIYIDDEGYFTCNTGITVDMWKTFLRDGKLMTPDRIDMLVKFYNEPDHKSTCRTLAEKYDNETVSAPQKYNSHNTHLGQALCKQLDMVVKRPNNEGDCYWIIAMMGKDLGNNYFEWKLRPELVQAMEELTYKIPCSGVISRPAASTSCRSFFITSAGIHLRSTLTVRTRLRLRTMSIGA